MKKLRRVVVWLAFLPLLLWNGLRARIGEVWAAAAALGTSEVDVQIIYA